MQLRQYQEEVKSKIRESFQKGNKSVMLQLPTGAGKTVSFVNIARDVIDNGKNVLILVHRVELIRQTYDKCLRHQLQVSVIHADFVYKKYCRLQIASVPTLANRVKGAKSKSLPENIDLIIIDEAHHATANSWRNILEFYPDAKVLGVTATPVRSNGEGFEDLFDDLVIGVTPKFLIENGYLAKPRIFANPLRFDLSKIKVKSTGDYNERDLVKNYEQSTTYGDLIKTWRDKANNMKTVVFGINIDHVKKIVDAFNEEGIPAVHLSSDFDNVTRNRVINDFKDGKVKILANVNIVTEGFDLPAIEAVMLVRPTKSLSLYLQMVGRGLRPAEGKDRAIILDHADCVAVHGFPEQDRIWTLKGWKTADERDVPVKKMKFKDLSTGEMFDPRELPDHITEIELIEVDGDEFRKAELDKLFELQAEKSFKAGWVWYEFINKYKVPTKEEIDYVRQKAGYKPAWGFYKMKEFGYIN